MFILLFCKINISSALTVNSSCQVVTAITNTFYFCYFTEHFTYLKFTFRTQTSFRNLIQIVSNLYLHIVTDILVFLYTAEQFIKIILIFRM